MNSVVGVFRSRADAERAASSIHSAGIPADRINFLSPKSTIEQVESVPTTDAEQPGMGKAFGAAVGGTIGIAGGFLLGPVAEQRAELPTRRSRTESPAMNYLCMRMRCDRADPS